MSVGRNWRHPRARLSVGPRDATPRAGHHQVRAPRRSLRRGVPAHGGCRCPRRRCAQSRRWTSVNSDGRPPTRRTSDDGRRSSRRSDGWSPLLARAHPEPPHLVGINWYRKLGRYQNSLETPANGLHLGGNARQKKSCKSVHSQGFSSPTENRGVLGSIPGLAISKDACTGASFGEVGGSGLGGAETAVLRAASFSRPFPSRCLTVCATA